MNYISELLSCEDPIDTPMMQIAAQFMGTNWSMVIRDLGISDPEIEQIKQQYFCVSIEETIYQLLLKWQYNCDNPAIGVLATFLWNREMYKCVHELKRYFKREIKPKINGNVTEATTESTE